MQVLTTFADEENTWKYKDKYKALCKEFSNASGLDAIRLIPESGVILIEIYDKGQTVRTALGLSQLELFDSKTLAAGLITYFRHLLGYPKIGRRKYLGTVEMPW